MGALTSRDWKGQFSAVRRSSRRSPGHAIVAETMRNRRLLTARNPGNGAPRERLRSTINQNDTSHHALRTQMRRACPKTRQFTGGLQSIKNNHFIILRLFCTIGVDAAKRGVIASLFTLRARVARRVGESFLPSSPWANARGRSGESFPLAWVAVPGGRSVRGPRSASSVGSRVTSSPQAVESL